MRATWKPSSPACARRFSESPGRPHPPLLLHLKEPTSLPGAPSSVLTPTGTAPRWNHQSNEGKADPGSYGSLAACRRADPAPILRITTTENKGRPPEAQRVKVVVRPVTQSGGTAYPGVLRNLPVHFRVTQTRTYAGGGAAGISPLIGPVDAWGGTLHGHGRPPQRKRGRTPRSVRGR